MSFSSRHRECRRVQDDVSVLAFERQCRLWKAKIETDLRANLAERSLVRWLDDLAGLDKIALLEHRPIFELEVEQVQFLIALRDGTVIVDPYKTVLDALALWIIARFVDTYGDEDRMLFCFFLEPEDEA